jgi:hypothetical protein
MATKVDETLRRITERAEMEEKVQMYKSQKQSTRARDRFLRNCCGYWVVTMYNRKGQNKCMVPGLTLCRFFPAPVEGRRSTPNMAKALAKARKFVADTTVTNAKVRVHLSVVEGNKPCLISYNVEAAMNPGHALKKIDRQRSWWLRMYLLRNAITNLRMSNKLDSEEVPSFGSDYSRWQDYLATPRLLELHPKTGEPYWKRAKPGMVEATEALQLVAVKARQALRSMDAFVRTILKREAAKTGTSNLHVDDDGDGGLEDDLLQALAQATPGTEEVGQRPGKAASKAGGRRALTALDTVAEDVDEDGLGDTPPHAATGQLTLDVDDEGDGGAPPAAAPAPAARQVVSVEDDEPGFLVLDAAEARAPVVPNVLAKKTPIINSGVTHSCNEDINATVAMLDFGADSDEGEDEDTRDDDAASLEPPALDLDGGSVRDVDDEHEDNDLGGGLVPAAAPTAAKNVDDDVEDQPPGLVRAGKGVSAIVASRRAKKAGKRWRKSQVFKVQPSVGVAPEPIDVSRRPREFDTGTHLQLASTKEYEWPRSLCGSDNYGIVAFLEDWSTKADPEAGMIQAEDESRELYQMCAGLEPVFIPLAITFSTEDSARKFADSMQPCMPELKLDVVPVGKLLCPSELDSDKIHESHRSSTTGDPNSTKQVSTWMDHRKTEIQGAEEMKAIMEASGLTAPVINVTETPSVDDEGTRVPQRIVNTAQMKDVARSVPNHLGEFDSNNIWNREAGKLTAEEEAALKASERHLLQHEAKLNAPRRRPDREWSALDESALSSVGLREVLGPRAPSVFGGTGKK